MKIILLSIALITAGFLTATAQNNISLLKKYQGENARFEYPDFEKSQLPTIKKTNSGQDWWEPDTVYVITPYGGEYDYGERFINKYNSHGLLKERIEQWCDIDPTTHTDGPWVNHSLHLYTYTYDSNNNILTRLGEQSWVNTSRMSSSLYIYTYDSNNNVLTSLLNNSILKTYTYDSNNNMLTELEQKKENNSWVNSTLKTYTYDSNNNRLSEQSQLWKNNLWVDLISHTNTHAYDSNNNVLTRLVDNYILYTYTYDSNNNRLTELLQLRRNNSWENYSQNLMTYDENGNGTSIESWRWRDESWQPNPNLNSFIILYYNNMQSNSRWGGHKLTASYINVANLTAIATPPATQGLNTVSIYPNPTKGELRIENGELRIQQVSFFDITGIHLFSTQQTILDVSHLPAGIYFVQIKTEKGMVAKKIVKW